MLTDTQSRRPPPWANVTVVPCTASPYCSRRFYLSSFFSLFFSPLLERQLVVHTTLQADLKKRQE